MNTGLAKELNQSGIEALRDYAVETYRTGGQWRGLEQDTIAVDDESFASAAALYYPGYIRGAGWYDTDSGGFFDPYMNPPVLLGSFMEKLATFRIGDHSVIASSFQCNAGDSINDIREIAEDSAEEWKKERIDSCSTPLEDGYRSYLLFYPNTGAYWIVSDYVAEPENQVIEDKGYAEREELVSHFQTMFPDESEDMLVSKYFHPNAA